MNNPKQEDYKAPQQGYYKATIKQEAELYSTNPQLYKSIQKQKTELREQIAHIVHQTDDDWGGGGFEECLKSADKILALTNTHTTKLLNEQLDGLEEKFKDSERRSGQGSRPQFSKDTETPGEWRSRTRGFQSGMLVALTAIENERERLK